MEEETFSHPTSRMVSINNVSFWLYWAACFVLFIFNHVFSQNPTKRFIEVIIFISAFICLLLYLIKPAIKSHTAALIFSACTYMFVPSIDDVAHHLSDYIVKLATPLIKFR